MLTVWGTDWLPLHIVCTVVQEPIKFKQIGIPSYSETIEKIPANF